MRRAIWLYEKPLMRVIANRPCETGSLNAGLFLIHLFLNQIKGTNVCEWILS